MEVFYAHFKWLALANDWSDEQKALQLAPCLTDYYLTLVSELIIMH